MVTVSRTALVIVASGSEEMEVVISVDVLRRAGVEVTVAGLDGPGEVSCSRGVRLLPDVALETVSAEFDVVVLPGGAEGAERLASSPRVGERLRKQWARGGLVAAICAAPLALLRHEIALGATITCHPSVKEQLATSYDLSIERVVASGQLLTSQGPGSSFEFALALVERLCGPSVAESVQKPMMLRG
jgi:protein DJ-1